MAEPDELLLTVLEAAGRARVNPETIRRWIKSGRLPAAKPAGGPYRIHSTDLERLLGAQDLPKPAPKGEALPSPPPAGAAVSAEERRAEDYIDKLLSTWSGSLWDTVHRWETAGYELQFAEISSILSTLEGLIATGLFQRSEAADPTDKYEAKRDFELEMIHKAVQRLVEVAEPVLEARAKDRKDREAQRVRRGFEVVEGSMRRAA